MIFFNQRKRKIDCGCHPGGAEHRSIAYENAVGLDPDVGKLGGQPVGIFPMGRGAAPVQQPGMCQQESARAS